MPRRLPRPFSDGASLPFLSVRLRVPTEPQRPSLLASIRFALHGLRYAFRTQRSFRIQAAAGTGVVALGALLRLPPYELALLVALGALVLCAELMNTALELFLDRIAGPAFDLSVKQIKDLAAGSVFVVCVGATVVGAAVFLPHLMPTLPAVAVADRAALVLAGFAVLGGLAVWAWLCGRHGWHPARVPMRLSTGIVFASTILLVLLWASSW